MPTQPDRAPRHYIQYIPRRVRHPGQPMGATHPGAEAGAPVGDFDRPRYHFTSATTGLVTQVRPGDTIWLVGQLATPWRRLPPSLDARLDVAACQSSATGHTFEAAPTSCWFPLADASAVLVKLTTERRNGQVEPLWGQPTQAIGLAIQQLRQLHDAQPLTNWARAVEARGFDFVSYRLRDGTRPAFEAVAVLLAAGRAVFWDRWSLPRQLAEYQHQADTEALKAFLSRKIEQANNVWGIATTLYAVQGSFSAYERAMAERAGHFADWPASGLGPAS